jgi:two-component system response regulator AtoC
MANILIIEDDEVFSELLVMFMEDRNHQPQSAHTLTQARKRLEESTPDVILLDQELPDGFGLELLKEIVQSPDHPPVIMITGVSDNKLIMQVMRLGAHDYIRKPVDDIALETTLGNALKSHRLSRQISAIKNPEDYQVDVGQIIGKSPSILDICKTVGSVATSNAPILITGESGTGKEVVARALHYHSERSGLLLPINCSALSENLLESELFGHEKGSFTGAVAAKEGKFELTEGGTLFLDELGEMPASLQAKLLRVLQEGTFERVGGTQTLHSSARIIAATNRDLQDMIANGSFREDLLYRLNVVHIHIPPLRERMEDLPLLIEHLLTKINQKQHTKVEHLAEIAWQCLKSYSWPGNIRELENILTRAAILARSDTITLEQLALPADSAVEQQGKADNEGEPVQRLITLDQLDSEYIKEILDYTRWHKGKACEILNISRPALDRKIAKYELS